MLGTRVKDLRIARHWSQVELGKIVGVSKQSISNWESDTIQPSIDVLIRLSDIFNVTTDYLLGRENVVRIELEGLSTEQAAHIQALVKDLQEKIVK